MLTLPRVGSWQGGGCVGFATTRVGLDGRLKQQVIVSSEDFTTTLIALKVHTSSM